MRERLLFLLKVFVLSILLFILWRAVFSTAYGLALRKMVTFFYHSFFNQKKTFIITGRAFYLIPYVSLVLATSRVRLQRKLCLVLLGFAFFFVFDLAAVLSGATLIVERTPPSSNPSLNALLVYVIYNTFFFTLPIMLWVLVTRGNLRTAAVPKNLTSGETLERICPLCGKEKAGLIDHIRMVHGNKSLKSWRVRRFLSQNPHLQTHLDSR